MTSSIDLSIDLPVVRKILTEFIHDQITCAGYQRAVINLSGGLDSAVACALAAEAVKPENVLVIRAPYKTSSPDSLEHAQLLIDQLGVRSVTIPITRMVDPLISLDRGMSAIRKGNIMARARMIVLYDQSEAFHGLPVGTGNKTEYLLGYTTLYGDSACAFNPIGDLYKTQVRQLARHMGIPAVIIQKPPSADLWVGQTDEGELGFTYDEVDRLLYLLIDLGRGQQECIQEGFSEAFICKVVARIRRTQFKRNPPPIARISNRTLRYDFLDQENWKN